MAPNISLCVILLEVSEDCSCVPDISYKASKYRNKPEQPQEEGGESPSSNTSTGVLEDLKFGIGDKTKTRGLRTPVTLNVETFEIGDDVVMDAKSGSPGKEEGATSQGNGDGDSLPKKIHFFSGNAFVEVTKGIIHLYKENERTPMDSTGKTAPSDMLVMLSIPTYISCRDLLQFLAPLQKNFDHIKVIRETTPNQYMTLLKCKSEEAADQVYNALNGAPYSSLEEEVCKVAFVSRVESMKDVSGEIGLPLIGHTELPTCPVCLERMDESVEGILTILCNHTFHSGCLAKWSDSRCPVCRHVQTPEMVAKNFCMECKSSDSLWICLICGHIGCGRYVAGHAYRHFCETSHCYAIQPDNNRVWDYAGDNFVHRLLQNKDGKLVEVNRRSDDECEEEDKDSHIQLEFAYMLTTQLESQRHYFEQSLEEQAKEFRKEVEKLQLKLAETSDKKQDLEYKFATCSKEKAALEKKYNQVSQKLAKLLNELKEERDLNRHLQKDQQKWQEMVKKLEADSAKYREEKTLEIIDLKEQLRDIMFFMEAQKQIEESPLRDEIVDGQVLVDGTDKPSTSKGRRKKRN